jgi:hypothetical protein
MSVTLPELLSLVGRLDDAPGFDSPRERYRRFLIERVKDVASARALIDECQRAVGEQRHRALQDLVVLVGRFLGFDITFGAYDRTTQHATGPLPVGRSGPSILAGRWRSHGTLDVALDVRSDQTTDITLDTLARVVRELPDPHTESDTRIGLCVMARHYAARSRLEQAVTADIRHGAELRIVGVRSLMALATQMSAGRIGHADVVKLFKSGFALDFVIDLLDRPAQESTAEEPQDSRVSPADDTEEPREPAFWVATIAGGTTTGAEQLLASVIAHRRVLGICASASFQDLGAPGDWVCFFLPGKGIVGHARLAAVVDGSTSIRNAQEFSRVYRLTDVDVYEEPIVQALRAQRPFTPPPADPSLPGPSLAPIGREDFTRFTRYRDAAPVKGLRAVSR